MPTTIGFETVQKYLSGLAALGNISGSPHGAFWMSKKVNGALVPATYEDFINGTVPNATSRDSPIPIIWKEFPILSPIFIILADPGFADVPQMIFGGVHLTDDNMHITLPDGTAVTGAQVLADLEVWLKNGFPKDPTAIPEPVPAVP